MLTSQQNNREHLTQLLSRYAAAYHLTGPTRDDLIEQTLMMLVSDPEALLDNPIEKAVANAMRRVYEADRTAGSRGWLS